MANSNIYFPIFSETIRTILKIFSQNVLRKVRFNAVIKIGY